MRIRYREKRYRIIAKKMEKPLLGTTQIPELTVSKFYNKCRVELRLELLAGESGLNNPIHEGILHRPGLALIGFYTIFANRRIQVFGKSESTYLKSLSITNRIGCWEEIFKHEVPCVITVGDDSLLPEILELANEYKVPLFKTSLHSIELFNKSSFLLHDLTAPTLSMHGTLVDVGGVGVILEGSPGIGKSETALGLIKHGNALIADDLTILSVNSYGDLIGRPKEYMRGFMEIRGLGVLFVPQLFGIAAVKMESRVDLIISLKRCNNEDDVDRIGSEVRMYDILSHSVQQLTIPVAAGRDFVNVVETAAATFKLRGNKFDSAALLSSQLTAHYKSLE